MNEIAMGNDLRNFQSAYSKIQEQMERLSRMTNPSYSSLLEQMDQAMGPIRAQHSQLTRAMELAGRSSSQLGLIVEANQRLQGLIDNTTVSTRIFQDLSQVHKTWTDKITPMHNGIAQLQATAKLSMSSVAYQLAVTELLFSKIDFGAIGRGFTLPNSTFLKLENSISGLVSTYNTLVNSIHNFSDLTYLPASALPGATRELFVTGHTIGAILIPDLTSREADECEIQLATEAEQTTSVCINLLRSIDPALVKPYIGARDALTSLSTDRVRHALSSLREFWNHLLRQLAPDNEVLSWVPKGDNELLHEGRPTRKARLLYICQSVNHEPLTEFMIQDTRAFGELFDLCNDMHKLEPGLSDEQLRALVLKTDSWIVYLLQVCERTT